MSRVFVYENWTHDRVRIHKADCGYCNDGRGTHAGSSVRDGTGHGLMIAKKLFVLPNGLIVTTLNLVRCARPSTE
jgi:hypothetical protein